MRFPLLKSDSLETTGVCEDKARAALIIIPLGGAVMAVAYHYHHAGRTTFRRLYARLRGHGKQRYHAIGWWCSTCGEQDDANLRNPRQSWLSEYSLG